MNWNELNAPGQLGEIKNESAEKTVLIFKHSARCNISRTTLSRLERHWNPAEMNDVKAYFLDLLSHRDISDTIAREFSVEHESPQVLIIRNGKSVLDLSHFQIDYAQIRESLRN